MFRKYIEPILCWIIVFTLSIIISFSFGAIEKEEVIFRVLIIVFSIFFYIKRGNLYLSHIDEIIHDIYDIATILMLSIILYVQNVVTITLIYTLIINILVIICNIYEKE